MDNHNFSDPSLCVSGIVEKDKQSTNELITVECYKELYLKRN